MPPGPSRQTSRDPDCSLQCQALQFGAAADEGIALGREIVAHLAQRLPQPVDAHDAVGLVPVGRWRKWGLCISDLKKLHRVMHALQAPESVRLNAQGRCAERIARVRR